ncbi:hypothetical protein MYCTH_2311946 [Thermothelomyces thermophilus ATCC 42464]|uniref:Uncharacterized protein n=1 Tax=Thermothelomyces thermophilus (strain ATCC 42464 / BCRC 31852 / DSM 1799) TaxID=573729 RepID=G2QPV5_THET4|nr:uncharacterized protein MYCTH_2311946 [Thermothelomyces thermophilus ATCC 42464]AEO61618.1 hypothetical protein MYCTH_2311946 [Thermothelomyces thermophilus ATCC 42464]
MAKPTPVARLRRTFHYPSSDDDDDDDASTSPAVLDEQEQESLIADLARQNDRRNQTTHRLLCALPLLSTLPFLLDLFLARAGRALPALGLSSLLATGWMLARLGVTETGFPALDGMYARGHGHGHGHGHGQLGRSRSRSRSRQRRLGGVGGVGGRGGRGGGGGILGASVSSGAKSPLETHLPWLNVALAALALLTGLLQRLKTGPVAAGVSPLMLGALPGVVYAVIIGAKVVMAGVDPERELSALKYAYKGA